MRKPSNKMQWRASFNRVRIVDWLESFQDLIVISLCLSLFGVMVVQLWVLVVTMIYDASFQEVSSEILFILILVELFRLLIIYLREHRISVSVAVEVAMVSVLREVIVHEVLKTDWIQLLAVGTFLLVLGCLLLIRAWILRLLHGSELPTLQPKDYEQHF